MDKDTAFQLTGFTREQVISGIRRGEIHPNSRVVAQHSISPQEITEAMPPPNMMVGVDHRLPKELAEELFGPEPSQDEQ